MPETKHPHKCCICGGTYYGWGNDPYPVKYRGRCCDMCNMTAVIPARLKAVGIDLEVNVVEK